MVSVEIDSRAGFTLMEVLVAALSFALAVASLLLVFIYCLGLNSISKNLTTAINGAQTKLEQISRHPFDTLLNDYSQAGTPGDNFSISGWTANHSGIIQIDDTNPLLLVVRLSISWQEKGGRIIGEDRNLDGTFSVATEDQNGNNRLDSPAQLITLITRY